MDHLDPDQRSFNMAKIRSKDTGPELLVRRVAHRLGLRFRLHRKDLPGRPDLVLPRRGLTVFVHGCFWHRHEACARASLPLTRRDFWESKFARTIERDARQREELERLGWRVLVLWECELRDTAALETRLLRASSGEWNV